MKQTITVIASMLMLIIIVSSCSSSGAQFNAVNYKIGSTDSITETEDRFNESNAHLTDLINTYGDKVTVNTTYGKVFVQIYEVQYSFNMNTWDQSASTSNIKLLHQTLDFLNKRGIAYQSESYRMESVTTWRIHWNARLVLLLYY